eukprot:CAMPEP_0194126868 /NCGR_PEP_ID=MMETSP0150-20130528/60211_1 /TAXON_ID=122233 /ORGANISM="Chaetoceros debilis, Strain MM31A-1" /LENGTH=509 /DNA_ID=CAMNT_0038820753 /DNA_START=2037 /DNA_END=3563 /DNA_ORIENTATION=+
MFLSKQFLVLPLLFTTVASQYDDDSSICYDDCDFKFDLNFAPAKKGCFWLTKNKKKASKRKETYCAKSEIKSACEATCHPWCENDSTFQFKLANSSGADKNVKCAWISKNRKKSASRKEKYCVGAAFSDASVNQVYCREACGRCSPNQGAKPTPEESAVNVVFNLHTDNYPQETSWALVDDAAGTVIKSDGARYTGFGDAFEANTLHSEAFALKRCVYYTLTVYDSFGDGLSPSIPTTPGYFEVFVEGQRVMGSSDGVAFESSDSVSIYVCEPTPEEPTPEESAVNVVFNLQTDEYPEETSWALIEFLGENGDYTYIKSDGKGYPTYEGDKFEANTLYSEAFELKRCAIYVLMVFDNVFDGLSGIYTPGYFEVFVEGQRVMGSSDGVAFESSDSVSIYVCEPTPEEPTPEESAVNVVFNLQTDEYPEETSWALIEFLGENGDYTYIKSDGKGYPTYEGDKFEANTLYSEAFELKRCAIYVLMVFDNVFDGLSGIYTPGYFEVFVEGQRV